ncbi:MAG: mannose-1-phosphate guanylyltransferase [Desulfomonilaceae bacterium]|nr:mannose-1-phosphate guanylyltransferase [Desulfomonilaceae bacterium]
MIYAVIMAGGSGTRFWPRSRSNRPKQLLTISGEKTMIRATIDRVLPLIPYDRVMVVAGASHVGEIAKQVPCLTGDMIVAEPCARNTAPCIALAAYKLRKIDPDAVMVVLPADHLIAKEQEFLQNLMKGADAAVQGDYLLTFGIFPSRPETAYGYIKLGPRELRIDSTGVFTVAGFVEKPDAETAEKYVTSGDYVWNSGMFVWKVSQIIHALETHLPGPARAMEEIVPSLNTPEEADAVRHAYETVDSVSIDYGVMEKAQNVLCIPVDVGWNDIGSWVALEEVWGRDDRGNASTGDVLNLETSNCIVSSPHKVAALIGVEDLIVVDTPDALLICRKDRAQDVKTLQEALKARGYGHLL